MSDSFVAAAAARAADAERWRGCVRVAHLPYLAFASKAERDQIRPVVVLDARASSATPFDLHADGFTVIDRHRTPELSALLPKVCDPHDRSAVVAEAYPAIARLVEALGASRQGGQRWRAIAYSHMHRYTVNCPSFTVHNDYTSPSQGVKQALKTLDGRESPADVERAMRLPFFAANVWTALATVRRDPLTVCRWNEGREVGDMGYARQKLGVDEWYWVPAMRRGEAVVFKQFDSLSLKAAPPTAALPTTASAEGEASGVTAGAPPASSAAEGARAAASAPRAEFTLHTSFREPPVRRGRSGPPPRRSIEYRVLVFEDSEGVLPATFGQATMDSLAATAAKAAAARPPLQEETTGMRADAA